MGSIGQLRMSKVNDLIQNLINQDKVLPDRLLIDDSAEIFDDDHDAIEQLQNVGR